MKKLITAWKHSPTRQKVWYASHAAILVHAFTVVMAMYCLLTGGNSFWLLLITFAAWQITLCATNIREEREHRRAEREAKAQH